MGQFPGRAVDIVDPVSPAGAQGASNIAGNLNAEADRKLKAAEIAAQSSIQQARIKADERMQTAQLDAQGVLAEQEISSRESEYQKLRDSNERQQQRELAAREARDKAAAEREDKFIKEQQAREDATNQKRLTALQAKTEAEERVAKAEIEAEEKVNKQAEEAMAAQTLLEKLRAGEAVNLEQLSQAFADQAAGDEQLALLMGEAVQLGATDVMLAATEKEPTLGKKLGNAVFDSSLGVPALASGEVIGVIAKSLLDTTANWLGRDTTDVPKTALTDGVMLVDRTVEGALRAPGVEGVLASAGDPELAKGAFRAAVRDVMLSLAAHNGQSSVSPAEADARATASLVKLKEQVPQAAIHGLFGAIGKLESDPTARKQRMEEAGATPSDNVKAAKKDALLYVRKFANNYERLTAKGPAAIAKRPVDFESIQSQVVGATSFAFGDPVASLKKLTQMGLTPDRAKKYLEMARERVKGTPDEATLMRTIEEAERQSRVLGTDVKKVKAKERFGAQKKAIDLGVTLPDDDADVLGE
jgi:hypothetical protein